MASIVYLRPRYSQDGVGRLLAEVEQAVAAGADLGDRRSVMCELTNDLYRNYARLQSAIVELKAMRAVGIGHDIENACMIEAGEDACADLLARLGPLLKRADFVNALLAAPDAKRVDPEAVRQQPSLTRKDRDNQTVTRSVDETGR